jgi:transposase InsO family protein
VIGWKEEEIAGQKVQIPIFESRWAEGASRQPHGRKSKKGRLRDECLNAEIFFSLEDARRKLERWRIDYNRDRPHSSIGNLAPIEFESSSRGEARRTGSRNRKSSTCDRYSFQGRVIRL